MNIGGKTMGGTTPTGGGTNPAEAIIADEQAKLEQERREREKRLQDVRLSLLRRRGGGQPGLQPQPNQPQTIG
jgi:hypothetical protein